MIGHLLVSHHSLFILWYVRYLLTGFFPVIIRVIDIDYDWTIVWMIFIVYWESLALKVEIFVSTVILHVIRPETEVGSVKSKVPGS